MRIICMVKKSLREAKPFIPKKKKTLKISNHNIFQDDHEGNTVYWRKVQYPGFR